MNCEVTRRWLDAYIDGELALTRQLDLEAHLAAVNLHNIWREILHDMWRISQGAEGFLSK